MNKIIAKGNISSDITDRISQTTNGDFHIVNFGIALNRKIKREGEPDADFFNCTAFGKTAELIAQYFEKGRPIIIIGHLQNDEYEKDGEKKRAVKIIIDEFEFADKKPTNAGAPQQMMPQTPQMTAPPIGMSQQMMPQTPQMTAPPIGMPQQMMPQAPQMAAPPMGMPQQMMPQAPQMSVPPMGMPPATPGLMNLPPGIAEELPFN